MSDLKLYNYFRSSTSYRVRIALEIKQLSYEYIPVHLLNNGGEQNHAEYRKLNPMGGVPTLQHSKFLLAQSYAIIEYLDEAFPQTYKLFPTQLQQKAKVREFCQIISSDVHSYGNLKTFQYLEKNYHVNEEGRFLWAQNWFGQGLTACEELLKKTSGLYSFGDTLTAADPFLVSTLFTANRYQVDLTGFPLINKVNERCLKLSEFQKAHPFRQPDTPSEFRI